MNKIPVVRNVRLVYLICMVLVWEIGNAYSHTSQSHTSISTSCDRAPAHAETSTTKQLLTITKIPHPHARRLGHHLIICLGSRLGVGGVDLQTGSYLQMKLRPHRRQTVPPRQKRCETAAVVANGGAGVLRVHRGVAQELKMKLQACLPPGNATRHLRTLTGSLASDYSGRPKCLFSRHRAAPPQAQM